MKNNTQLTPEMGEKELYAIQTEAAKEFKKAQLLAAWRMNAAKIWNQKHLAKQPKKEHIKQGSGGPYLPISYSEQLLRDLFGSFEVHNTAWSLVANEIFYTLSVSVIHPATGERWTVHGAGSSQIRMRKNDDGTKANPTDLSLKIMNGGEMDFPRAKSMAFSNAVKGFGNIFGANLGRKDSAETITKETGERQFAEFKEKLENAKSVLDIAEVQLAIEGTWLDEFQPALKAIEKKESELYALPQGQMDQIKGQTQINF